MNAYMDAQTEDRIAHPVAALLADSKLPGHGRLTAQVIRSLGATWPLHGGGFGDDLPVILRTLIREGRTAGEERRMVIRVIRQARAPLLTVSPEERLKQVRPLILGRHLLSARSFSCQVDALWELLRPEEADDPAWTGRPFQRRHVFLGVLHEVLPREDDEDDEDNWLACGQYGPLPARYGAPESMSATRQRWVQAAADSLWALAGQVGVQDDAWVQSQLLTVFHHAWLPALAALRPPEGSSFRQVLEWSSARRDATVWIWSDRWLGPLRWPQWDELRHRAHAESWREAAVLQDTDHDGRRHSFHRQQNARERRPVEMKRALLRWPSPGLCMEMVNGERYAGIDFSWLKDDPELQAALPGLLEMSPDLRELLS